MLKGGMNIDVEGGGGGVNIDVEGGGGGGGEYRC